MPFGNIESPQTLSPAKTRKGGSDECHENRCPPGSGLDGVARRANCDGHFVHPKSPPNPHPLLFLIVYDACIVVAVGAAALRSDWRDRRLLLALFLVPTAIGVANWIEGAWYLPNVGIDWRGTLVFDVVSGAVAALLWYVIFRRAEVPESAVSSILPERPFAQKVWRFVLCSAIYVFLYFLAGTIIFPFVRDYYATQHLPSFGQIVAMQFLVRGPVFILVCLTLLSNVSPSPLVWWTGGWVGVHLHQRSCGINHAEWNLPRTSSLGALLRSHQL